MSRKSLIAVVISLVISPITLLPNAANAETVPATFAFQGSGYGHGVGMSQWGALAMAQRGDTYAAILRHYYRGTELQPYGELARTASAERGLGNDDPRTLAASP